MSLHTQLEQNVQVAKIYLSFVNNYLTLAQIYPEHAEGYYGRAQKFQNDILRLKGGAMSILTTENNPHNERLCNELDRLASVGASKLTDFLLSDIRNSQSQDSLRFH